MCGFIGVFGEDGFDVVPQVLRGLQAIQHRGQDAAGIVTLKDKFHAKKGLGLVQDVFSTKHLDRLQGNLAVGHVRYPTVGAGTEKDVQPFWLDFPMGIAMAHNGNVTNFLDLKQSYFMERGIHMSSNCDLEAVLYSFTTALIKSGNNEITPERIFKAVEEVFARVKGSYSVVGIISGVGMFAFRDPYGIKPIIMGERDGEGVSYAISSESVVLDVNGYSRQRDIQPGEAVFIDMQRQVHSRRLADKPHRPCIFELVYFARPDSFLDQVSVYKARLRMGKVLADKWRLTGLRADVVIPVPESARISALSMSQELGITYREGFVKNRYIGRTFIMPHDSDRRRSIRNKLNTIGLEFKGKDVLIVDDSIVRGNTSRQLIQLAREAGANKVFMASSSPPLRYPCPYGIDMSTKKEFIARDREIEDVARVIGCDALVYQELEDLEECGLQGNEELDAFCMACFNGEYPTGDMTPEVLESISRERTSAQSER